MDIDKKILQEKDFDALFKIAVQQNKEISNLEKSLNAQIKITEMNVATIKKLKEKPKIKKEKENKQKLEKAYLELREKELKLKKQSVFN